MQTPANLFKKALRERRVQIGFWLSLADSLSAEICAGAGFDWLLIDGEHAPQDPRGIMTQLQAIAAYPACHAVVRVPSSDPVVIKQYLDLGAQTLLVPMVDTPEQAASIVQACRYPPQGKRGIGGARAARWGRYADYLSRSNEEVCVLVQVETATALANLEAIANVEGVDGVFIGPADLAASLGHPGNPGEPLVQAAIIEAAQRIGNCGKTAGILTRDEALARRLLATGAVFVAVGMDSFLLSTGTSALASRFADCRERGAFAVR